jgi:hypothetical protein
MNHSWPCSGDPGTKPLFNRKLLGWKDNCNGSDDLRLDWRLGTMGTQIGREAIGVVAAFCSAILI